VRSNSILKRMLVLTDGKQELKLNYEECVDLELKLNVSAYGKLWGHIGEVLYEYGAKNPPKKRK